MKKLTNVLLFSTILLTACTQDDISNQQNAADGTLRFAPEMATDWNAPWTRSAAGDDVAVQQVADGLYLHTLVSQGISRSTTGDITRSGKYTGTDDGNGNKTFASDGTETFHVSGYRYAAAGGVNSVNGANFLSNAEVTYSGGQWRATNQSYVMPAATDKIDFFAWFLPTGTTGVTANSNTQGAPQLTYTVPATLAEQPDLLAAVTRDETFDSRESYAVPLSFSHQLTAVNFVLDENVAPGTITEVAFLNVYTTATLTVGGTWDTTDGTAPGETKFSTTFNTVSGEALRTGETIIGPLMMIPQQFNDNNQQIRIKITIDGAEKTLYADLEGTRWEPNTTVTYKVSTSAVNVLRIGTVSFPTSWSEASTENSDIKNNYVNGDEIGVYGVDADGKVIFANKKYTLTGGSWVADDGTKSLFVPGHTYYAYYPYQETLSGGPAENANVLVSEALPTAAEFFAAAVTNWTPADDQSTATLLNAQDLQIARSNPSTISTVTFNMAHTMGLVSLTLEQKSLPTTRYFEVNADNTVSTTSYTDIGTTSVTAANDFAQDENMLAKDNKRYYVMKHGQEMTVTSTSTAAGKWKAASVTLTAAAAAYNKGTAELARTYLYRGWAYSYRQKSQPFTPPVNGGYQIECWGASGGYIPSGQYKCNPGLGGYVKGTINLLTTNTLHVYVGENGYNVFSRTSWNGGGWGTRAQSGGGATDVRLISGDWSNTTSLYSRIMVAGGGGGGDAYVDGGHAGGLTGYAGGRRSGTPGQGGSQTAGGSGTPSGSLGKGGSEPYSNYDEIDGGGGGGGWYGGGHGIGGCDAGGGGSSFISGFSGCRAISGYVSETNNSVVKYNGNYYEFSGAEMYDGKGFKWNSTIATTTRGFNDPDGKPVNGHSGNGFCRIAATFLE